MKFWKHLNNLIEQTLPEWRDKFLTYKDLKKHLKQTHPSGNKRPRLAERPDDDEVSGFLRLLEGEIDKFNLFFMDLEEDYIMKLEVLRGRVAKALDSDEELMRIGREIVDFHGEMVLLLNYSALNYIGLVKILKKYDKRSGALVRLPFIKNVLQQPFFSTDILNNLVKECETMLDTFFPLKEQLTTYQAAEDEEDYTEIGAEEKNGISQLPEELAEIRHVESRYMKQTLTALDVLNKIRSGSSTVSMFSLPPMGNKKK